LKNIGLILFDIDGVIRSVENSYRLSLKKTVYKFSGWEPSYIDIDNAKNEGIWNNDWDLSLEFIKRFKKKRKLNLEIPSREKIIKDINNKKETLEKQINKTIDEISNCKALALDEIKKAINIVKSNYIFNLETSTQLSSFFGNELLWGRKSSINNLESHLKYWNDLDNFKEITEYIRGEKFTLVASPSKC